MAPDAPPLPVKREEIEKTVAKHKREVEQAASPARRNNCGTPARPAAMRKPRAICTRSASRN